MASATCLVSCSSAGGTIGKVDCYRITVYEGGSTIFNATYSASYTRVYEYKSADGDKLYTSSRVGYMNYDSYATTDAIIRAYPNRYTNDYKEYTFSRFVGFLTCEYNYYLNLGDRIIDSEIKWSEYKYENDPSELKSGETANNKEAFNCAKKNYYQDFYSGSEYVSLRLDLAESSLERHTYTMLGDSSVITYTAKHF